MKVFLNKPAGKKWTNRLVPALVAAALCAASPAQAQSCDSLPANVVSWWSGESNAVDNLGLNNGNLIGGVTFAPGMVGNAFQFSGSGQFIRVPDSPSLRFTTAMTLEAWVYPTAYQAQNSDSTIFCKYQAPGGFDGQSAYSFFVNHDGRGGILTCSDAFDGVTNVFTTDVCPLNTWTHLAATYDGSTLAIYFNGVMENSASVPPIFPGTYDLGIGANLGGVTDGGAAALFIGMIDEPTVYSRALSANEVAAIYNAGSLGKCEQPVTIVNNPASQTVYATTSPTFNVAVSGGTPYSYQWYFNGTNISGATNSTLTLTNVQVSQSGNYTVGVSNSVSSAPALSGPGVLTVLPAPSCDGPASGIVSWWAGENNSLDNFGVNNGNPGSSFGNPANTPVYGPGKVGTAFNFNGGQWIRVPDSPGLRFTNGMTLEAWVYPVAYNAPDSAVIAKYGTLVAGSDRFAYTQSAYALYLDASGHANVGISKDGTTSAGVVTAGDFCPTNAWSHIAATYDGSTLSIYFNGAFENSIAVSGNIIAGNYDLGIGATVGGAGPKSGQFIFSGLIDEPSVYNRALSGSEIQAIYNADITGKCRPAITITSQPTNVSVPYLGSTTLSVGAIGGQLLTYQWKFNGTNLPGATNSSLTLSNLQLSQSGTYYAALTNAVGPLNSSNAVLTVIPPPPCVTVPSNIISWWAAEGNALDSVGGNNGTPVGSPTFAAGKDGQAFNFNGSSQFFRVPDAPNLHVSNAMTAEAWVYPTGYNNNGTQILCKYQAPFGVSGQSSWAFFLTPDGYGALLATTNAGATGTEIYSTNICPLNTWTYLAATYDGSNMNMYFNGLRQSNAPFSGNLFPGTYDLGIGANIGGVDNGSAISFFQGMIDEPALYNRALTSNEIAAIYNAGAEGKCAVSLPPALVILPSPLRLPPGTSSNFDALVSGSPTLTYQWKFNGTNISGATNRALAFMNVTTTNVGTYSLTASNSINSTTVTAQLEIVLVTLFANGVPLTGSQYAFTNSATIQLSNYFSGGAIFYTLDGSTPSAGSTLYTGAFVLSTNSIVRTIGYSTDFQQSAISDAVTITFPPAYSLTATVAGGGGGSLSLSPAGTNYFSNTVVTVTATPSNGWTLLQWNGDVGGSSLSNTLVMDRNKSVQAVFGTAVSNSVGGNGSVAFDPPGGFYPFGTPLQVSAIPQSGNYFVLWGSAASGNVNPLTFPVTNANQSISALFTSLSAGQVALAVVPVGPGTVAVNPPANAYSTGASVTITATPATNHTFLGWSGSASGTTNPLNVQLNQSKTIYANFSTNHTALVISPVTRPGTADGIVLDLNGQPGAHYRVDVSSNLITWTNLYDLTNYVGTIHYIDSNASGFNHRYYHAESLVP